MHQVGFIYKIIQEWTVNRTHTHTHTHTQNKIILLSFITNQIIKLSLNLKKQLEI
jgi:hypothetical protein